MISAKGISALLCGALLALPGCASSNSDRGGARGPGGSAMAERRDGPPRAAPGRPRAEPGLIVAADLALARAAREDGLAIAFAEAAAANAQYHGPDGPVDAARWLATLGSANPGTRWQPQAVWAACDGALAISRGRSVTAAGVVGSYVTVWQRHGEDGYRWLYHIAATDIPQPPASPAEAPFEEGRIIVTRDEAIDGRTADCLPAPPLAPPRLAIMAAGWRDGEGEAPDRSLRWRWVHQTDGIARFTADWLREGRWQTAFTFTRPAGG